MQPFDDIGSLIGGLAIWKAIVLILYKLAVNVEI
jgi:hypothetical protein